MFDYLVVGAGFAGGTIAERLASDAGKKVLICDRRPHIGGNAYDHYDAAGILVHKYGPHIFHTNSRDVYEYLSMFTSWRPYQHRVQAWVDGQLLPIPINLDTVNRMYGLNLTSFELDDFFSTVAEPRESTVMIARFPFSGTAPNRTPASSSAPTHSSPTLSSISLSSSRM